MPNFADHAGTDRGDRSTAGSNTEREVLAITFGIVAAGAGPIAASPKPKGAKYRLNAFGADVLYPLRFSAINAWSSAEGISVRLAADDLHLNSAQ
jgi:hypothetical protein